MLGLQLQYHAELRLKVSSDGSEPIKNRLLSDIATKGLVIRSRCLPDFHQTEIKVVLDEQSTNTNLSNPRCYFGCGLKRQQCH